MSAIEQLKELLDKIGKTNVPVRIEINYDGREFKWRVPMNNVLANEYVARPANTVPGHVDTAIRK